MLVAALENHCFLYKLRTPGMPSGPIFDEVDALLSDVAETESSFVEE